MNLPSKTSVTLLTIVFIFIGWLSPKYWLYLALSYLICQLSNKKLFHRIVSTLPRDLKALRLLIRVRFRIRKQLWLNKPLHQIFLNVVKKNPKKTAIIEVETRRQFTFEQLNALCNQYAHFFQSEEHDCGDVVSLFMENNADFLAIWLGLSKIGVVASWINSHLKSEPLAHSIKISKCKSVITSRTLFPLLAEVIEEGLISPLKVYVIDDDKELMNGCLSIKDLINTFSAEEPVCANPPDFRSILCFIYTSGTTGNPKPAVIRHFRYYWMAMGVSESFNIGPNDVMYVTMPMYHSAAGILGIGQVILQGCTAVIRSRFSASNFWKDCCLYDCTVSQYIGEICRYLLARKPAPEENRHKVRLMFGNGLRPELWNEFVSRFNISRIGELYGSTEGNSNIVNIDNHVGACGFFPIYPGLSPLYPLRLIKVDEETGEFIRGKDGLCVPCKPGELGEVVGVIRESDILLRFEGYVDSNDTAKKIIRNCFAKGDAVFTSGDLIYWDEYGYFFFKDRRGDTFRWKGENVSTTEVESVFTPLKSIADVAVYGVQIPGKEGRAGMASVVLCDGVNQEEMISEISTGVYRSLPNYAIPVFLRVCERFDRTGTFKLKKVKLQKEGYDLKTCNDAIFFWDSSLAKYRVLDAELQRAIDSGTYSRL
uniref:Very long-chain fatty acid transport protein n=1 Tax=Syphacia muris TaxID=451379 RepID=A0A0N5AR79_9BILA